MMKAFRGTILAAVALLAVLALVKVFDPSPPPTNKRGDLERPLFTFEKQELVRIVVERPDGVTVALKETPSGWIIEDSGFTASRTMVNRVKHQLHDLTARAMVVETTDDLALYGLGKQAITVTLTLRDGREIKLRAGDPNPSAVSYYIQPLPGDAIYTVKKSAVDYYSLSLEEFRERRFASFETKDVASLEAELEGGRRLKIQRAGEQSWDMLEPTAMAINADDAKSLLGRVTILKAQRFVEDLPETGGDLAKYGLDAPRARITLTFGGRDPLTLRVGARVPDSTPDEPLAYMLIEGDRTVYAAREALLEDFNADTASFRLRRFSRMEGLEVTQISATMHRPADGQPDDPTGLVTLKSVTDVWQWGDGQPVSGSTPRRLAMRAAGLDAEEFVDDSPSSLTPYGLDDPLATITLTDLGGRTITLLIGKEGPAREQEGEERPIPRVYAKLADEAPVYLVERSVLEVLEDALREQSRKSDKDVDKAQRREAIDVERGDVAPGAAGGEASEGD